MIESSERSDGAFERFYELEYPSAARLAWFLTRGSSDFEDLAQDALIRVRRSFAGLENPAAYLRVAVVNACRDRHRRMGREEARMRAAEFRVPSSDSFDVELLSVVAGLSYDHRAVVTLRYWADLSDRQIAEAVGTSETTVRTRLHRAIKLLKKEMDHDH